MKDKHCLSLITSLDTLVECDMPHSNVMCQTQALFSIQPHISSEYVNDFGNSQCLLQIVGNP